MQQGQLQNIDRIKINEERKHFEAVISLCKLNRSWREANHLILDYNLKTA